MYVWNERNNIILCTGKRYYTKERRAPDCVLSMITALREIPDNVVWYMNYYIYYIYTKRLYYRYTYYTEWSSNSVYENKPRSFHVISQLFFITPCIHNIIIILIITVRYIYINNKHNILWGMYKENARARRPNELKFIFRQYKYYNTYNIYCYIIIIIERYGFISTDYNIWTVCDMLSVLIKLLLFFFYCPRTEIILLLSIDDKFI